MPTYIVKNGHIIHGAKDAKTATLYAPGDEIELTFKEARALGDNVEPVQQGAASRKGGKDTKPEDKKA